MIFFCCTFCPNKIYIFLICLEDIFLIQFYFFLRVVVVFSVCCFLTTLRNVVFVTAQTVQCAVQSVSVCSMKYAYILHACTIKHIYRLVFTHSILVRSLFHTLNILTYIHMYTYRHMYACMYCMQCMQILFCTYFFSPQCCFYFCYCCCCFCC